MKAVRLVETREPLEMQEIPVPEVDPQDVLVRVKAAGICHSDAHYRAGVSRVDPLPMTLGHEVAGIVEKVGSDVTGFDKGDRVCLHYLVTCGHCKYCHMGSEQFCTSGSMIGKYRDGGYAEYIVIPARSVFHLPDEIPFEEGAIMMCSSSTSYHALRKTRLQPGERVAIFGSGGLGMSAIQLAFAMGAVQVFAVDINPEKLKQAELYGATPINAKDDDPVQVIKTNTGEEGVDVALELIGLSVTMKQAFDSLAVFGRLGLVGLSEGQFSFDPYNEMMMREAEIIGVSDHLAQEIPTLIELVRTGRLDLSGVISETIPLDADLINQVMDNLDTYRHKGRIVITP